MYLREVAVSRAAVGRLSGAAGRAGLVVLLTAAVLAPGFGGVVAQQTTTATTASSLPTITLSFTDGQPTPAPITGVSEGGGAQTVRVVATASAAVTAQVSVSVTVGAAGGTALKRGGDYQTSSDSVTVTINSGTTGSSGDITITPGDDDRVEGEEYIRFEAGAVSGYQDITPVSLRLVDDDDAIVLSVSPGAVMEHTASQTVGVTASFAGSASDLAGVYRGDGYRCGGCGGGRGGVGG